MSTEQDDYTRGLAVCHEHHPPNDCGVVSLTKSDIIRIVGRQARELETLRAVERTAYRVTCCLAEFPDDPSCCAEHVDAMDAALLEYDRCHRAVERAAFHDRTGI